MIRRVETVAIAAAAIVCGVLLVAATRPDTFEVRRTATIGASPDRVFALINDLHAFNAWNPYERKDPHLRGTYAGPSAGKGATYAFDGDRNVGKGVVEIVDSSPASSVTMNLRMEEPFEASNVVQFVLEPDGETTKVTWAMQGRVPYVAKIVHLFLDVDAMVGRDFEAGLATLKQMAEQREMTAGAR